MRIKGPHLILTFAFATLGVLGLSYGTLYGDALRTVDVWTTGLLVIVASRLRGPAFTALLSRILLFAWLVSGLFYALDYLRPDLSRALLDSRPTIGLATTSAFSTPSRIFDIDVNRPTGMMLYANELALCAAVTVGILTALKVVRSAKLTLLMVLATGSLLLSTSRSLILTFACALLIFLASRLPGKDSTPTTRATVLAFAGIVAATVAYLSAGALEAQADELAAARYGGSADLRSESYSVGWELFKANPIIGLGGLPQLGNIQAGSHSLPISALVRAGAVGGLVVLLLLLYAAGVGLASLFRGSWRFAFLGSLLIATVASSPTIQFDDDIFSFVAFIAAVELLYQNRKGALDGPATVSRLPARFAAGHTRQPTFPQVADTRLPLSPSK